MLSFNGKVAIVTGAGNGMGRAYALELAARGAKIVVNDVVVKNATAVVSEIMEMGGQAIENHDDIVSGSNRIIESALIAYGKIDILVNNAGIVRTGLFSEHDPDDWWRVFDVSFKGTVEMTRAAWPSLVKSGSARIVNVSSSGMLSNPGSTAYSAAKAAVWAFSNSLAAEGVAYGINVNTILPSAMTPMADQMFSSFPDLQEILKKTMTPKHVSSFVAFLCHSDTTISGRTFRVSGNTVGELVLAGKTIIKAESAEEWASLSTQFNLNQDIINTYQTTTELAVEDMANTSPEVVSILDSGKHPFNTYK